MAETSGQEKTEAPTARRLREAREEGNIARSTDLTAALMLLMTIVLLYMLSTRLFEAMAAVLHRLLSSVDGMNPTRSDDLASIGHYLMGLLGWTVLPLLIAVAGVGVLVTAGQTGLMLTGKPMMPKFRSSSPRWRSRSSIWISTRSRRCPR